MRGSPSDGHSTVAPAASGPILVLPLIRRSGTFSPQAGSKVPSTQPLEAGGRVQQLPGLTLSFVSTRSGE